MKNKRGRVVNAPYVDCSYKWAGGGLLSTVEDLARFGNAMLYSYQNKTSQESNTGKTTPGYLKSETMNAVWTPVTNTREWWGTAQGAGYGMGWGVIPHRERAGSVPCQRFYASHTGGAIGASSVLLVMPSCVDNENQSNLTGATTDLTGSGSFVAQPAPRGVVVAMITNMQAVGLNATALKIAKLFQNS